MLDPNLSVRGNTLDNYPSQWIPFEKQRSLYAEQGVKSQSAMKTVEDSDMLKLPKFDDVVDEIHKHRRKLGRREVSHDVLRRHMLDHTRKLGLDDAQGKGFWSSLWHGIKKGGEWAYNHVIKPIGSDVGQAVHQTVQSVAQNPLAAVATLAPLLV